MNWQSDRPLDHHLVLLQIHRSTANIPLMIHKYFVPKLERLKIFLMNNYNLLKIISVFEKKSIFLSQPERNDRGK